MELRYASGYSKFYPKSYKNLSKCQGPLFPFNAFKKNPIFWSQERALRPLVMFFDIENELTHKISKKMIEIPLT